MKELEFVKIDVNSDEYLLEQVLSVYMSNSAYFNLSGGNDPSMETLIESLNALPKKSSYEDKVFEIIYLDSEPIGIVDIINSYPEMSTSFIGLFIIDANLHGRGLGKCVFSKLQNRLKQEGAKVIKLGVLDNNEQAFKFWKKNGFKILEKKTEKNQKGDYWTFYLMAKEI